MAHRVLVCGSRHFENVDMVEHILDAELAKIGPKMYLIVGGASGADEIARAWAVDRKCDHEVRYARWGTEGKAAGFLRNSRMLRRKPRLVLAFLIDDPTANVGTKDTVKKARAAGVKAKQFVDRKIAKR